MREGPQGPLQRRQGGALGTAGPWKGLSNKPVALGRCGRLGGGQWLAGGEGRVAVGGSGAWEAAVGLWDITTWVSPKGISGVACPRLSSGAPHLSPEFCFPDEGAQDLSTSQKSGGFPPPPPPTPAPSPHLGCRNSFLLPALSASPPNPSSTWLPGYPPRGRAEQPSVPFKSAGSPHPLWDHLGLLSMTTKSQGFDLPAKAVPCAIRGTEAGA